ncbi:MAG: orotate phosphoribosyltransferase [Alphaproteobacteria bacterium]
MAELTARMLLEVRAIEFRPEQPFIFSSGWASPVYIDCRALISYPRLRRALIRLAVAKITRAIGFERIEAVAGGETAGIPFAAWIADALDLPLYYVRKAPKAGSGQLDGDLRLGRRVLLVEDLATDGRSKLDFAHALRGGGAEVAHSFVVFFYDIFPGARERLESAELALHYLVTWRDVLRVARAGFGFDPARLAEVEAFLDDPIGWSAAHGGIDRMPG